MDAFLLDIKAVEQRLVDYLNVYKRCRTLEERREVQQLILECEAWIAYIRTSAATTESAKEFLPM